MDKQYLVARLKPLFRAGGLVHFAVHFFFIRMHFWLDLLGSELTVLDVQGRADIVNYSAVCGRMDASNENLRFKLHAEVDFNECLLGLVGFVILDPVDCRWEKYYLTSPLVDVGLSDFDKKWSIVPEYCLKSKDLTFYATSDEVNDETPNTDGNVDAQN